MTKEDVITLLAEHQNERGIANWQTMPASEHLQSFGIGLTQLRKLAKSIGRDHQLSLTLWQSNVYDAKVIALLIDDPKQITKKQAEQQVEELNAGMLSHVFSACDATLAKSPLAFELANEWKSTTDEYRRKSAYGLLYELSKNKRNKQLTTEYFLSCLGELETKLLDESETPSMRLAMGTALMGIGKRNKMLNKRAIAIATAVGPIDFNEASNKKCDPFNVLKHLNNPSLQAKLT